MAQPLTPFAPVRPRFGPDGWTWAALAVAVLMVMPVAAVVWLALRPADNIWPHLLATTLPRYLGHALLLMAAVGLVAGVVGTGTAWLVTMYRFAGRGWLQWALLMPLAVPTYVAAYALVDVLEFAGPVQRTLRALFGWERPGDYWFPQVRSIGAAIIVMSFALAPYVYLLARAAFREQSGAAHDVARALGVGPWGRFARVGLPLARPAVAAGVAVVMMETVNDFGAVDFFGVQTLTTGIFSVWLQAGNLGGAAQLALCMLALMALLVVGEKLARARARQHGAARGARPVVAAQLRGWRGAAAMIACLVPVLIGFVLPVIVLMAHAGQAAEWAAPGLVSALWHSITVGSIAALATVGLGGLLAYGARQSRGRLAQALLPVTAVGYAVPGAVLGIGVLIPLAALDQRLADGWLALTGTDPGLILTGSAAAIVLACMVRFFAVAQGAADGAFGRVPPSLPMAARSLGLTQGAALAQVYLPLMRGTAGAAVLLVFVDCVKELPATLLLRPFGYETLATRVHAKAHLEQLAEAAPAALTITAVGLIAVALLARTQR